MLKKNYAFKNQGFIETNNKFCSCGGRKLNNNIDSLFVV